MWKLVAILAAVPAAALRAEPRPAAPLRAGVCILEITPPIGYRMSGYFSERLSTGVRDPLLAKAIVFRQGKQSAALVFADVVGISLAVSNQVREKASRITGIPRAHIAVAATHSHTGPLYFGALRKHFHDKAAARHGTDPHEKTDYPAYLAGRIVEAIKQANIGCVTEMRLAAGYARETRLSFNRRFRMKNGKVRFNPGQRNPNIVRVAGPIDPEVGIITLSPGGRGVPAALRDKPFAAITSFALHLDTVGGTLYSADFPKYLQDQLRKKYRRDFVSMFGAGTCGDINHVDVKIRGRRTAEQIGTMLAETVIKQIPKLTPIQQPRLGVKSTTVHAELQTFTPQQIAAARQQMEQVDSRKLPFLDRVKAYKIMALQLRKGKTIPLEVQAVCLSSDVAIVTLPGEVFVELGMAIKQASPFKTTLVIELTNDAPGYLPTRMAFAEGSYETVNSRIQPGWGEKMAAAAARILKELHRQPAGDTPR